MEIITPSNPEQRGCQLSLKFSCSAEEVQKKLLHQGTLVSAQKKLKSKLILTISFLVWHKEAQHHEGSSYSTIQHLHWCAELCQTAEGNIVSAAYHQILILIWCTYLMVNCTEVYYYAFNNITVSVLVWYSAPYMYDLCWTPCMH